MPFVFDSTCGSATANSFVSVTDADYYFEGSAYYGSWPTTSFGADLTTKQKALVSATRLLNSLEWDGLRTTYTQSLQWPRVNLIDRDGNGVATDIIPQDIKDATCELASSLLGANPDDLVDDGLRQFKRVKIGTLEIETADMAPRYEMPDRVMSLVFRYLTFAGNETRILRS